MCFAGTRCVLLALEAPGSFGFICWRLSSGLEPEAFGSHKTIYSAKMTGILLAAANLVGRDRAREQFDPVPTVTAALSSKHLDGPAVLSRKQFIHASSNSSSPFVRS